MQEKKQKNYLIEEDLQIFDNPYLDMERYYTIQCLKQKDIKTIKQFLKKKGNNGMIIFSNQVKNGRKYMKFDSIKQLDKKFIKSDTWFSLKNENTINQTNINDEIKKKICNNEKLIEIISENESTASNQKEEKKIQLDEKSPSNYSQEQLNNIYENVNHNKDHFAQVLKGNEYLEWKPYEDEILKEQKYHSTGYQLLVYYKTKSEVLKRMEHILV